MAQAGLHLDGCIDRIVILFELMWVMIVFSWISLCVWKKKMTYYWRIHLDEKENDLSCQLI